MKQVNFIAYEYTVQFGCKKISPKSYVPCVGGVCPVAVSPLKIKYKVSIFRSISSLSRTNMFYGRNFYFIT